jgi:pimeloyl-ACP methyl ester carboxylesterase
MTLSSMREQRLPADTEERLVGFTELVATVIANAQAPVELRNYAKERVAPQPVATMVARGAAPEDGLLRTAVRDGGQLAVEAAFRWPDRVAGLVLVGSAPVGAPSVDTVGEEIDKLFDAIEAAETAGDTGEVNRLEAHLWLDGPLTTEHRVGGATRELFLDMNGRALTAPPRGDEQELPSRWDQMAEIGVPTLVLVGEHDLPLLVHRARAMAAGVPGARLAILAESAHLPMLDRPKALIDELDAFLAGL